MDLTIGGIFLLLILCSGGYGSPNDGSFLLVADNYLERIFQINVTSGSNVTLPLGDPKWPLSVDYDPNTDFVYWSDRVDRDIKRARRDGSGRESIVTNGIISSYDLALDFAAGNLYWTDSRAKTVSVARMNGSFARSLLTSPAVGRPGGLVLDPRNGYMYWTDWGSDPRIDRAAMDGSNHTTIISDLNDPNMITMDYKGNRLYYCDGGAHSIFSSDLLGNDIRRLLYLPSDYLFGIAIDDDSVYWTSWTTKHIGMLSRSNMRQTVLVDSLSNPMDIYVSMATPTDVTNACSTSNGGCQDMCLANPEGRTCACRFLWELQKDGTSCLPKKLVSPSYLWLDYDPDNTVTSVKMTAGNSSVIRDLYAQGSPFPVETLFISEAPSRIEAIDYDFRRNLVFWADTGLREIHTVELQDGGIRSYSTLLEGISSGVEGMAVDWLNQNLYYTDGYFNWIGVVNYKYKPSRHHVIVHEGVDWPRGIAVHPIAGFVFWSDRGSQNPRIERAVLSGEQRTTLVKDDIVHPSGLVIDGNRLYWADTYRDRIESCDLNGNNRILFYGIVGTHFYDITFDGEEILASDWSDDSINFIAGHVHGKPLIYYRGEGYVYGVEFFDQSRQLSGQTECQVDNGGCNHTCVGDPDGHRCLCLSNFHLARDNHSCIANEHPFSKALFVGSDSGILQLPHNFRKLPEAGDWTDSYIVQGTKAFAMDFDYAGKMMFYTQQQDDGTQTIERLSMIGEGSSMTIFENGQGIEGIAVDWVASNLYWTERQLGRIHVSKLDGSLRKVLISNLDQPSAIAVHPGSSYVFWSEVGADPKISRASSDGSNKLLLVSSQSEDIIGNPTALAIDYLQNRVYWVTSDPGNVQSCNLYGGDVKTLWSSTTANLLGVAIYKDYVLWTENTNQTLASGIPFYGGIFNMKTTTLSTAPYNIKVYDDTEQPVYTSVCDHQNGLCMELCIPSGESRVCACAEGRYIQEDRVSCADLRPSIPSTTVTPTATTGGFRPGPADFVLVADSSTGNISEVNVTSGSNVTLPLYSTLPMALDYDVETGYVYWSDFIDEKIYRAKRDGSGFEAVINKSVIGVYGIYGIALDYAGQNIYWTDWGTEIVGVAGMDGSYARAIFSENIDYPGGIALDPEEGYLYWTDAAFRNPRIERAAMDGSERTTLISSGLGYPTGIAIDLKERRLYWGDSGTNNIKSSDLYGNNQRTVVDHSSTSFFDLSLHVNDLFWTGRSEFIGVNAKSQEGQGSTRVLADGFTSLRGIAMYRSGLMTNFTNACSSESGGGCQDMCLARPGGKTCVCRAYFVLQKDNTTCAPPEIKAPSYLWINLLEGGTTVVRMFEGNSSMIRNLAQQTVQVTNLLAARPPSLVVSLDYDIRQGLVFWIDIGLKEIQQVDVRTGQVTALKTEVSTGAEAIAADWVNKNLYYTDYNYNRIVVVSYSTDNSNGNSHILAETGLDRPRGIAVDPSAAFVFWSDWGLSPKIERSTLSGEGRTVIVESDLGRPSGLVIDYVTNRLYFADTERDTIDSCDFDGGNRERFYSRSGTHFYDIAFDGEEIMATDWSDRTINFIHSSRNILAYSASGVRRVLGVEFYDESRQATGQSDCQVNNGGCQHTCVGDQSGHKCLCLPDYTLAEDNKSCMKNDHLFTKALLVSTDEGILQFPHNLADLPGTADSKPTVLVRGGKTVAMDFNYNEKAVYYAQEIDGGMQSIQKYELATNRSFEIYSRPYSEGQGIAGIAVDWVTSNVYWTDGGYSGKISVARLNGSSRKILMAYLNNPKGIAVHPELKLLYWTEAGAYSPSISRSTLAGTGREVIISPGLGVSIRKPTALSIDFLNSRVYWADSVTGTVMSSDLRGKDPQQHWTSNGGQLFGVAVYKDFTFWTDRTNKTLSIGLRSTLRKVVQLQPTPHSVRVFDGSEQPLSRGPCSLQNGGCNELCLPTTSDQKICACEDGHLLQPDDLTCINPANIPTTTAAVTIPATKPAAITRASTIAPTFCPENTLPPVTNGEFGSCSFIATGETCNVVCRPNYKPTVISINCLPGGIWNTSTEYACARVATPEAVSIDVSFSFPTVPCTNDASTLVSAKASLINNFRRQRICETASQTNVDVCNADQMTLSCSDSGTRKRRELEDAGLQQLFAALSKDGHSPKTRLSQSQHKLTLEKQAILPYQEAYRKKRRVDLDKTNLASSLTVGNSDGVVVHLVKKDEAEKDRILFKRVKRATNGLDVDIEVKATPDTSDENLEESISKTRANVQNVVDEIRMEVDSGNVAVEVDGQKYTADPDSFKALPVKYECPSGTIEIDGGCGSVPRNGKSNGAAVAVGVIVALLLLGAISLGGYMYYRRKQRTYPGQNVRLKDLETQENPVYGINETPPYNAGLGEGADGGFLDLTKAHPENVVQIEALPEKLAPSAPDWEGFDDGKLSNEAAAQEEHAVTAPSAPITVDGVPNLAEEEEKVPVANWETFDDGKPVAEAASPAGYEATIPDPGPSSAQGDMANPTDWEIFDDDKLAKEAAAQQELETQTLDAYTVQGGISNPMYASRGEAEGNA